MNKLKYIKNIKLKNFYLKVFEKIKNKKKFE